MTETEKLNKKATLVSKQYDWYGYLKYLKDWANSHKEIEYCGMSPACYNEWCDIEAELEEE